MVTLLFSDRGIPNGFRHMHGYGCHTFKLFNSSAHPVNAKFLWGSNQGIKNINSTLACKLAGTDPDYAIRDLHNAIKAGRYPSWTLKVQIMTFQQAARWKFNPFDVTKVSSE